MVLIIGEFGNGATLKKVTGTFPTVGYEPDTFLTNTSR